MFAPLLVIIYLAFISLGLPDTLLGAAWPSIYPEFHVPLSHAGAISMTIAAGTILSSLMSERITGRMGTGAVTAGSVAVTAVALFGFSFASSYPMLILWAVPYGLGAGSVDASLNNYVALHYESRHMSWLHCMWGIGASAGPHIMAYCLGNRGGWHMGYRCIGALQLMLTVVLFLSLPLWQRSKTHRAVTEEHSAFPPSEHTARSRSLRPALSFRDILRLPGATAVMLCFFAYSALESTAGLWASSYLVICKGIHPETAASFMGLLFFGVTIGRAISGFMTIRFPDDRMIQIGLCIIAAGLFFLLLPAGTRCALTGLILIGLGCAPIYPSIIHSTPSHFGAERSQAVIGVQMASAYVGSCFMPPLFGLIANHLTVAWFPAFLLVLLTLIAVMHCRLLRALASGKHALKSGGHGQNR